MQIEAAKRDATNFGPIYNKYYKQIFGYIYQRMEDKDVAFDVTSQVFLKALTNLHKYEFKGVPFASWLYRIPGKTCKEGGREACLAGTDGGPIPWLNQAS